MQSFTFCASTRQITYLGAYLGGLPSGDAGGHKGRDALQLWRAAAVGRGLPARGRVGEALRRQERRRGGRRHCRHVSDAGGRERRPGHPLGRLFRPGPAAGHPPEASELKDYMPTVPFIAGETWDQLLYRISQLFSLHGQNKDALAKTQLGAWEYDVIGPWYKCNMTDIMAGIGLAQLSRYQGMLERRREIIGRYDAALAGLPVAVLKHYGEDFAGSGHLYITRLLGRTDQERRDVIVKMAERGIACNVHYKPLPMMTAYKALGFDIKDFPNAYNLFVNEVTLPLIM